MVFCSWRTVILLPLPFLLPPSRVYVWCLEDFDSFPPALASLISSREKDLFRVYALQAAICKADNKIAQMSLFAKDLAQQGIDSREALSKTEHLLANSWAELLPSAGQHLSTGAKCNYINFFKVSILVNIFVMF